MQLFFMMGLLTLLSGYVVMLTVNSNISKAVNSKKVDDYAQNYILHNDLATRFIINNLSVNQQVYLSGKTRSVITCSKINEANIMSNSQALLNYQTSQCYDYNALTSNTTVYLISNAELPSTENSKTINIQMVLTKMKETLSTNYVAGSDESYYSYLLVTVNQSCTVSENFSRLPKFSDDTQYTSYNNMIKTLCQAMVSSGSINLSKPVFNSLYIKNITR